MEFGDTPEELAFREEARAFLEANAPRRRGAGDSVRLRAEADEEAQGRHLEQCREWQRTLFEHGWAAITWPKEYGGRGGTAMHRVIFQQEQARFDVTNGYFGATIAMFGPTLIVHGSTAQQARYLPPLLRGDELWCQLFSEPGAGSDLASVRTRAVLDGDEWVVEGQKVWTSNAQFADQAMLLARTDPDAPKHKGITAFVCDMRSPGIEVRPLRQMHGATHFNEVFLSEVRIPRDAVLGEAHRGWGVARTTLGNESAMIGGISSLATWDELRGLAIATGSAGDRCTRQRLADAYTHMRIREFLNLRVQTALSQGRRPGPEGSVLKLVVSRLATRVGDLALAMQGPDGVLGSADALESGYWQYQFMNQYAVRIGGGTEQVHHNMLGEQVLGLPAEPRVDKDVPFKDLPA